MNKPIIIGVAGGSGSGKTTLTRKLYDNFSQDVLIICHDSYYRDQSELSFDTRTKTNYDHPDAFETELLIEQLHALLRGESVEVPVYSFVEHTRTSERVLTHPARVIILEGILILENPALRELMDIKVFVDTDADIRLIRRIMRDVNERGRDLYSVTEQYINTVKPMHERFIEPSKRYADIIIPEGGHNYVALSMLIDKINSILAEEA